MKKKLLVFLMIFTGCTNNTKVDKKENVSIIGKSKLVYKGIIGDEILC